MRDWSTACLDWRERITEQPHRSLVPIEPLFPDQAEAALEIFRSLKIVDAVGQPTFGEAGRPWILDFVAAVFGAYDPEEGRRLIQNFFLLISKKNGKSTLAAGIMITALIRNWRDSGEFYILAPTKEIADNSYAPARDMVLADPVLRDILKPSAGRVIEHRTKHAFLKVVAADSETVSGKKTIGLLVDELHVFGKRSNAGSMLLEATGGLASRPEGFVIYLSTQSDVPPTGVFEQKLKEFRDIRDGKIDVPSSLPVLYEFPPALLVDDQFRQPKNWYVTNPNLGASVDAQFLAEKLAEAERAGRAQVAGFLAKHLNIQIGQSHRADGWAGTLVWDRGIDRSLTLDELLARSEVVTIGIDGGGLDDLLGIGIVGREKGTTRHFGWAHALISDVGLERRKANLEYYDQFEADGDLTKFVYQRLEGASLPQNVQFIVDLVKRVQSLGLLAQVGVDAAGIGTIVDALARIGVTQAAENLDAVRQGIGLMAAFKTIEIKLADYSFIHGGSRLLAWCAGNARIVITPTASRIAREEAGFGKIDPLVALFNAEHLMSLNPQAAGNSGWNTDDIDALMAKIDAKAAEVEIPNGPAVLSGVVGGL